jgi:hypothetical protein
MFANVESSTVDYGINLELLVIKIKKKGRYLRYG